MNILQTMLNGALSAGLSGIIALGLSLLVGVLKVINLAYGELIVGAGYLAFVATQVLSVPLPIAIPIVIVLVMAFGYGMQRGLLSPLMKGGQDGPFVTSFGLSLLLQGLYSQIFTNDTRSLAPVTNLGSMGMDLFGMRVQTIYFIAFIIALVLTAVTWVVLHRTRVGAAVRAAALDQVTAETQGVNVTRMFSWVMAFCAGIAAIGGIVYGVAAGFGPSQGFVILFTGVVVVVLGGVGNVWGTFLAAVFIGIVSSSLTAWLGGGFQAIVIYVLVLVLLALRPQGIFSRASGA